MSLIIKNIFSEQWKQTYADLRLATKATETCGMASSLEFIAAPWETGGGGMLGVLRLSDCKRDPPVLKLKGHTGAIQDTAFNHIETNIIATGSEDTHIKLWKIPGNFNEKTEIKESIASLESHSKKVMFVQWSSAVNNILASGSFDSTVKLWDVEESACITNMKLDECPYSIAWNNHGDLLVATTKSRNFSLLDPRSGTQVAEITCHEGNKAIKAIFLDGFAGIDTGILTTGFSKNFGRELKIWDHRKANEPILLVELDKSSQSLYPTFDEVTGMLYVAGKGDGNVRAFQFHSGQLHKAGEYKSNVPTKTFSFIPKLGCDTTRCEIARMLKCENGKIIIPISFVVPRKNADVFQKDLYPNPPAMEESISKEQWLAEEPYEIVRYEHREAAEKAQTHFVIGKSQSSNDAHPRTSKNRGSEDSIELVNARLKIQELEGIIQDLKQKLDMKNIKKYGSSKIGRKGSFTEMSEFLNEVSGDVFRKK